MFVGFQVTDPNLKLFCALFADMTTRLKRIYEHKDETKVIFAKTVFPSRDEFHGALSGMDNVNFAIHEELETQFSPSAQSPSHRRLF